MLRGFEVIAKDGVEANEELAHDGGDDEVEGFAVGV